MSKLLSICIPTWNRSKILDEALSYLLPQVEEFNDYIEVIISDNCSLDETKNVIEKFKNHYSSLEICDFYQTENTGFFGNFKKCKELAKGTYIWLLSDDDFVRKGVLRLIMAKLSFRTDDIAILYLNKPTKTFNFRGEAKYVETSLLKLFKIYNYQLTLISSSIFRNIKDNDQFIFDKFNGSHLIGFALLVDVIRYGEKAIILNGDFLKYRMAIVKGYNIFDAFVFDIFKIYRYMLDIGYQEVIIKKIKYNLIKYTWAKRYFILKATGHLDGELETYNLVTVDRIFKLHFCDTLGYWLYIYPIKIVPSYLLKLFLPFVIRIRNFMKMNA